MRPFQKLRERLLTEKPVTIDISGAPIIHTNNSFPDGYILITPYWVPGCDKDCWCRTKKKIGVK